VRVTVGHWGGRRRLRGWRDRIGRRRTRHLHSAARWKPVHAEWWGRTDSHRRRRRACRMLAVMVHRVASVSRAGGRIVGVYRHVVGDSRVGRRRRHVEACCYVLTCSEGDESWSKSRGRRTVSALKEGLGFSWPELRISATPCSVTALKKEV
jgi:hypothetical protein